MLAPVSYRVRRRHVDDPLLSVHVADAVVIGYASLRREQRLLQSQVIDLLSL